MRLLVVIRKFLSITFLLLSYAAIAQGPSAIRNELIVQFGGAAVPADTKFTNKPISTQCLVPAMNIWLLTFEKDVEPSEWNAMAQDKAVLAIQYNHRIDFRSTTPNDLDSLQWNLMNYGLSGGIFGADIDALNAWDSTTGGTTRQGDTIVVAVVDGKFNLFHEEISYFKNRDESYNGLDDDLNGYIDDVNGWNAATLNDDVHTLISSHPTQMAGIVGAKGNNGIGIAGLNWNVKILPIVSNATEAQAVVAYGYIVAQKRLYLQTGGVQGAYIVASSSSFGIDAADPADYPIWCSMYDSMGAVGVISATAGPNDDVDIDVIGDMPTACVSEFLISVSATNRRDQRRVGHGFGDSCMDIHAPGEAIYTTSGDNSYTSVTGCSPATPQVAGTAALLMSYVCEQFLDDYLSNPASTALYLKKWILESVDKLPSLEGMSVSEGRLNTYKSLLAANNYGCSACSFVPVYHFSNSCISESNGAIWLDPSIDTSGISFSWSNGSSASGIRNLAEGLYTVEISDASSCVQSRSFYIQQNALLSVDTISTTPFYSSSGGTIWIQASGSVVPARYAVDGGSFQSIGYFTALSAGDHLVQVQDENQCIWDTIVHIDDHSGLNEAGSEWHIYPIPMQDMLFIEMEEMGELNLFNLTGEIIGSWMKNEFTFKLPVHTLPASIYILELKNKERVRRISLLK